MTPEDSNFKKIYLRGMVAELGPEYSAKFDQHIIDLRAQLEQIPDKGDRNIFVLAMAYLGFEHSAG